ncbi:MAG TPA: hypothetical protein VKS22_06535 [Candidatus Binataceae bacterium]|nr:hypothetical protein [Candidatus Binataceae bacterium]
MNKDDTNSNQLVGRIAIWLKPLRDGLAKLNRIDESPGVTEHSLHIADGTEIIRASSKGVE